MRWMILAVALGAAATAHADDKALRKRGEQVYVRWCQACHGTGTGKPGTHALEAKYEGTTTSPLITERDDLLPAATKTFVRMGVSVMPFFRKTEISDPELEALAAFLAPKTKK